MNRLKNPDLDITKCYNIEEGVKAQINQLRSKALNNPLENSYNEICTEVLKLIEGQLSQIDVGSNFHYYYETDYNSKVQELKKLEARQK